MNFENNKAIYLQIADYICEQILLKRWGEGEKIPSIRELAVSLEVNPNTVMRTYAFLEEKNIIKTQRGIGYFVGDAAHKNVMNFKKEEFVEEDLPRLFKSMNLLKMDMDELKKLYEKRSKHEKE